MKFLIQKIDRKIKHDFSFTLIQAIDYHRWHDKKSKICYSFCNDVKLINPYLLEVVPIGSVEFVCEYLNRIGCKEPKPKNVPEELFDYVCRNIINGTKKDIVGKKFVKSNDKIKKEPIIIDNNLNDIAEGNYQISEVIPDIESEWRGFVYNNKLVGLQNYCGDFTMFPNVQFIQSIIDRYKYIGAPISMDFRI